VPIPQGRELLRDIHAGVCGHHAAPRTLVGNAFRQGFYWPTAVADASEIVRTCEGCQFYTRKSNLPAHVLQTIPVTWTFAVWGLDIAGPCERRSGATPTFWSLLTSSPTGWRCAPSRNSG
jgi:predicted choloylglycine hydrolase